MWLLRNKKGSNMIVCVLLVSNSRGCCLAAPSDHEGTPWCLIPIITWCHHFFHSNQYSADEKQFKVWFESNRSLRCHVTTLSWLQVSQSPPPPNMRVPVFLRETVRVKSNCARPASSATRGENEVDHAVCLQAEFQMHTVFSNENDKFYTIMIYPCFSRSVCFLMGSPAWWRLVFVQAGVPSCPDDVTLRSCTREFQMWRCKCKQIDPHWFQGRQMRFWWMLSTISWK